jgi:hypothetical protein
LDPAVEKVLRQCAVAVQGEYRPLTQTVHDAWIESLIQYSLEPFWICDTDIIFWSRMTRSRAWRTFAGRFEPEFDEAWTRCRHMARLHTSLLWIDPAAARAEMRAFMAQIPDFLRCSAEFPFVRQHFVPLTTVEGTEGRKMEILFYDTMAGLWHACGGSKFGEPENVAYDHLHCATYSDLISPAVDLRAQHAAIFKNPYLAEHIRHQQNAYYASRKPKEPFTAVTQD